MHQNPNNPIAHRDLKPDNILLVNDTNDNIEIKVSDFGFSCFVDEDMGLDRPCGTPFYMAPELVPEDSHADV